MGRLRNTISKVMPRSWATDMEAESRQWMIGCDSCGFEQSVWDAGGVRWKAAGTPHMRRLCPNCGKVGWHTITKHSD